MKFLTPYTHILHGLHPTDMNDRKSEHTAVELALPTNFSAKAKLSWRYFEGAGFIFEYKDRLVVTDESLYLTESGNGSIDAPIGCPRWICDSWEELEHNLEENYDLLIKEELLNRH